MENVGKRIGQRISERRKQLKLTQEQITDIVGISENQLSRIECGRAFPQSETVIKLAKALQTTTDYILIGYKKDETMIAEILEGSKICTTRERKMIADFISLLIKNREEDI